MARKLLTLYGLMALAAVALHVAFGNPVGTLLLPGPSAPLAPAADVALGVALGVLTIALSHLASARLTSMRFVERELRELVSAMPTRQAALVTAFGAMAEELLFRGFLQPLLGLTITSVLFGAMHVPHRKEMIPWPIAGVAMGFAFGGLVLWRGSVVGPLVAHVVINYFNTWHLLRPLTPEEA